MGLYSIPKEMEYIDYLIGESDGEITPEIEAAIKEIQERVENQSDDFCAWIRSLDAYAKADKGEADFFTKRRRAKENLKERVRKMLVDAMVATGLDKIRGARFTVSLRQASIPSIRWTGEGDMPKKFTRTVIEPDGDKIRQAYKDGKLPDGFTVTYSQWPDIR